jgi:hypothetical protein
MSRFFKSFLAGAVGLSAVAVGSFTSEAEAMTLPFRSSGAPVISGWATNGRFSPQSQSRPGVMLGHVPGMGRAYAPPRQPIYRYDPARIQANQQISQQRQQQFRSSTQYRSNQNLNAERDKLRLNAERDRQRAEENADYQYTLSQRSRGLCPRNAFDSGPLVPYKSC